MAVEPLPPIRELLNLGIVLECPFLHQIVLPPTLQTTVVSSKGMSSGVTTYSYAGTRLVKSVFVGSGAEKVIDYHYTPADPAEKIETLSTELAKTKEELKAAKKEKDAARVATLKKKVELQKSDLKKLKKEAKSKGFNPMLLQRTTFVENSPGQVGVSGETVFQYDGGNIVAAVTTSKTDEDPPRLAEVERKYTYNDLGQLAEMDMAGCVTEFTYAPTGQLLSSSGGFVSPTGDFISEDRCVYTYAPPGADPIPANALIGSVTTARSGPAGEFGLPSPSLTEEEKLAGMVPGVDPKEQMSKLTEKKKAEAEEAPSTKGAEVAALPEPPPVAVAAPEKLLDIPEPEATDTQVTGVYVYA